MSPPTRPCWVVTTPGLEALAAKELAALGIVPGAVEGGGVSFTASAPQLADALLQLRSVNRVTVRLTDFSARTFGELERHAALVDWAAVIQPGSAVHFRVTSKKSRLYHQDAIAERLERIAMAAVPGCHAVRAAGEAELLEGDVAALPGVQRIIVRIMRDVVTLSADASGALLSRRGWRQYSGKAPLRESLAAAMLLGMNWHGQLPLTDPFGGSGTIAIEAALLARRMAPGRDRRFALEHWPSFDPSIMTEARLRAQALELESAPVMISCYDRDDGAVAGARANAERAGVAGDIQIERATITMLEVDEGEGLLITNPPYGARVGERMPLRDLYTVLGRVAREERPRWTLALLSADALLTGHIRIPFEEVWHTTNGGLPVRLLRQRQ